MLFYQEGDEKFEATVAWLDDFMRRFCMNNKKSAAKNLKIKVRVYILLDLFFSMYCLIFVESNMNLVQISETCI